MTTALVYLKDPSIPLRSILESRTFHEYIGIGLCFRAAYQHAASDMYNYHIQRIRNSINEKGIFDKEDMILAERYAAHAGIDPKDYKAFFEENVLRKIL